MKNRILLLFSFCLLSTIQAQKKTYNLLLQTHVDADGNVNYSNFKKDENKLTRYISYLEKTVPTLHWSKNKAKAFWINAYNAYTIKLILDNYPLKSITSINQKEKDAWNIPFALVGGKVYTLNQIEHKILRKKFSDPRIHVGVNCASNSCPKLGNSAFTEENIETALEQLMHTFINDIHRNKITEKNLQISKIFDWFTTDFTKEGSLIDYLNKYTTTTINENAKIQYLKYDWALNGE